MSDVVEVQIVGHPAYCAACVVLSQSGAEIDERRALLRGGEVHALPAQRSTSSDAPLCESPETTLVGRS